MLCEEKEGEAKQMNVVGGGRKSDLYRCDTGDRADGSHTSGRRRSGVHGGGGGKAAGNGDAEEYSTLHLPASRSCRLNVSQKTNKFYTFSIYFER